MPTRWVIRGLSEMVDTIDGCALTEMQILGSRQGIDLWKCHRREAIKRLEKAGFIWEEETPQEVLDRIEEVRRHYRGATISREGEADRILLPLRLWRILFKRGKNASKIR